MQPTFYVPIFFCVIIAILFTGERVRWTWRFVALCQILAATSLATLTMLGGATFAIPQAAVAVLAVTAFIVVAPRDPEAARLSMSIHVFGLLIVVETLLISAFGPRLFAGQISVFAMRPELVDGVSVATPLGPKASNITHAVYLAGSFITALATTIVFRSKLTAADFRDAIFVTAALHVVFGLVDSLGSIIGQDGLLDFLRNGNYSMLDQEVGGVSRLAGQLTEPSSYASMAAPLAAFCTEEWVRRRKAIPGLIGLACWTLTLMSTSTTGIISFAVYVAILAPRLLISGIGFRLTLILGAVLVFAGLGVVGYALFNPAGFSGVMDFVSLLTVGKVGSQSQIERTMWTLQGWEAFKVSFGLGTGAGSFRSSSWLTAVLGSLGVVGSLLMLVYVGQIVRVLARATSKIDPTRKSAGWGALMVLVPAIVSGPTCDPGFLFGMFAGFALCPGLRQPAGKTARMSGRRLTALSGAQPG